VGRAGPMDAFAQFVRGLHADPRVRFARCIDVARELADTTHNR
jgi:hypothetical protein